MYNNEVFAPVQPRPLPEASACTFYHYIDFPDGGSVDGVWDIRGRFDQYIGGVSVKGKTVLDIGTATGFLAFAAEEAGATVTAHEGLQGSEYTQVHFAGQPYHDDRILHDGHMQNWFETLKNGFWYCWHKRKSNVEMVYAPLDALPYWQRTFDVVIAGAILEHLSDSALTIMSLARLADEAVIIAFTHVAFDDKKYMATANGWLDASSIYTWWTLSSGLYRQIFANVGFSCDFTTAVAVINGQENHRPTIVARRVRDRKGLPLAT